MQIKLGEKIKELRKRDGRKQEDLATALGVTCQAVSRWESGGSYPDMELIPSLANFFGISIDELFGYESSRESKVNRYFDEIIEMNHKNNGVDTCMDECIAYARECLAEFPDDKKLMYALATSLFNAGYVRYHEHHLTDVDGYDIYDTKLHRRYHEWQEAIKLYEKVLTSLEPGELRDMTVRELLQLYLNTGEKGKALSVIETLSDISSCREMMMINSSDGKDRAAACAEALLKVMSKCVELMIYSVLVNEANFTPDISVEIIRNAIKMFELVMPDGNYGIYHAKIASINLFLSEKLWCAGDRDGAFDALDQALEYARKTETARSVSGKYYTAPAVSLAKIEQKEFTEAGIAKNLPNDWPWWSVPGMETVKSQMQSDPRWNEWVKRTQE